MKLLNLIFILVFAWLNPCSGNCCSKVVDVYILAGQSNAVGYNNINTYVPASFPDSLRRQENIMFWPGSNATDSLKNSWIALQIGASIVGKYAFGPEISNTPI